MTTQGDEPMTRPGGPDARPGGPVDGMELAEAVEAVRQGLMAGAARGAGSGIRFEVGEIHMEFSVQLQRTRTGRAGVKAWVVDAGGDASRALGRTHTVSFTLRPVDAATGRSPLIAAPDEGDVSGLRDVPGPGEGEGDGVGGDGGDGDGSRPDGRY
jgi:hypothetical protein